MDKLPLWQEYAIKNNWNAISDEQRRVLAKKYIDTELPKRSAYQQLDALEQMQAQSDLERDFLSFRVPEKKEYSPSANIVSPKNLYREDETISYGPATTDPEPTTLPGKAKQFIKEKFYGVPSKPQTEYLPYEREATLLAETSPLYRMMMYGEGPNIVESVNGKPVGPQAPKQALSPDTLARYEEAKMRTAQADPEGYSSFEKLKMLLYKKTVESTINKAAVSRMSPVEQERMKELQAESDAAYNAPTPGGMREMMHGYLTQIANTANRYLPEDKKMPMPDAPRRDHGTGTNLADAVVGMGFELPFFMAGEKIAGARGAFMLPGMLSAYYDEKLKGTFKDIAVRDMLDYAKGNFKVSKSGKPLDEIGELAGLKPGQQVNNMQDFADLGPTKLALAGAKGLIESYALEGILPHFAKTTDRVLAHRLAKNTGPIQQKLEYAGIKGAEAAADVAAMTGVFTGSQYGVGAIDKSQAPQGTLMDNASANAMMMGLLKVTGVPSLNDMKLPGRGWKISAASKNRATEAFANEMGIGKAEVAKKLKTEEGKAELREVLAEKINRENDAYIAEVAKAAELPAMAEKYGKDMDTIALAKQKDLLTEYQSRMVQHIDKTADMQTIENTLFKGGIPADLIDMKALGIEPLPEPIKNRMAEDALIKVLQMRQQREVGASREKAAVEAQKPIAGDPAEMPIPEGVLPAMGEVPVVPADRSKQRQSEYTTGQYSSGKTREAIDRARDGIIEYYEKLPPDVQAAAAKDPGVLLDNIDKYAAGYKGLSQKIKDRALSEAMDYINVKAGNIDDAMVQRIVAQEEARLAERSQEMTPVENVPEELPARGEKRQGKEQQQWREIENVPENVPLDTIAPKTYADKPIYIEEVAKNMRRAESRQEIERYKNELYANKRLRPEQKERIDQIYAKEIDKFLNLNERWSQKVDTDALEAMGSKDTAQDKYGTPTNFMARHLEAAMEGMEFLDKPYLPVVKKLNEMPEHKMAQSFVGRNVIMRNLDNKARLVKEVGREIFDDFFRPMTIAEANKTLELRDMDSFTKDVNKKYSAATRKEAGVYGVSMQDAGPATLEKMGIKANRDYNALSTEAKELVDMYRAAWDSRIDQLNAARRMAGQDEIKKIDDYFTLVRKMTMADKLGIDLINSPASEISEINMGKRGTTFKYKNRKFDTREVELDIAKAFAVWDAAASKAIHTAPIATKLNQVLDAATKFQKNNPQMYGYMREWLDKWSGMVKPDTVDTNRVNALLRGMARNLSAADIAYNLSTILQQPTQLIETMALVGITPTIKSIPHNFTYHAPDGKVYKNGEWAEKMSRVLRETQLKLIQDELKDVQRGGIIDPSKVFNDATAQAIDKWVSAVSQKKAAAIELGMKPMAIIDYHMRKMGWQAAFEKAYEVNGKRGLKGKERIDESVWAADEAIMKTQASGSPIWTAPLQDKAWGKALTLWGTWAVNRANFVINDIIRREGGNISRGEAAQRMLRLIALYAVANTAYEFLGYGFDKATYEMFGKPLPLLSNLGSGPAPIDKLMQKSTGMTFPEHVFGVIPGGMKNRAKAMSGSIPGIVAGEYMGILPIVGSVKYGAENIGGPVLSLLSNTAAVPTGGNKVSVPRLAGKWLGVPASGMVAKVGNAIMNEDDYIREAYNVTDQKKIRQREKRQNRADDENYQERMKDKKERRTERMRSRLNR